MTKRDEIIETMARAFDAGWKEHIWIGTSHPMFTEEMSKTILTALEQSMSPELRAAWEKEQNDDTN